MSAIGSYAVVKRAEFPKCLARASEVRSETTGRVFKKTRVVGVEEFNDAWRDALVHEVVFDYSGYVIGQYLDVQTNINNVVLIDEQSEVATTLSKVFTAGFVFEQPVSLPDLSPEKLRDYCLDEWGEDDAEGMVEALNAAHLFYQRGFAEISPEHLVVFIIN